MNNLIKKKDVIWNTIGSILYAIVSFALSIIVIKIIGSSEGGLFSFGYSTLSQIALIISYFGIRPYQIVDVNFKYGFKDYYSHRIITSVLSIFIIYSYIVIMYVLKIYSLYKSIALMLIILSGVIEGFADCFDCEFQRNNKLYLSGQSIFFRTLFYAVSLVFTLYYTKNLLLSVLIATLVKLFVVFILSINKYIFHFKNTIEISLKKFNSLTYETYSLFAIVLIDIIIFSLPKFLIDINNGDIYSGYFNLYFMPVNGIYLLINLIIKPLLTPISNIYYIDKNRYEGIFNKIIIISTILCLFVLILSFILKDVYIYIINYITNNLYSNIDKDLTRNIFVLNMFGGALYSVTAPIYYILIISNKQKEIMYIYIISLFLSIIIAMFFLKSFSVLGASISFVINNLIILIFLIFLRFKNE